LPQGERAQRLARRGHHAVPMTRTPSNNLEQLVETQWPRYNQGATFTDQVDGKRRPARAAGEQAVEPLADAPPRTVLDFYVSRYRHSGSAAEWTERICNGQVKIDGRRVCDALTPLPAGGSTLQYVRRPWREPEAPNYVRLLYEDEHVLALSKPAGLQVLGGGVFYQRSVVSILGLLASCRDKGAVPCERSSSFISLEFESGSCPRAQVAAPVHRLGRGTSGVLLCAYSQKARRTLSDLLSRHATFEEEGRLGESAVELGATPGMHDAGWVTKKYRARAQGLIQEEEQLITARIGRVGYDGVHEGLFVATPDGKAARTKCTVLHRCRASGSTLVELTLYTGRPHQIRIHLASIGHPLVGDPLYGVGGTPDPTRAPSHSFHKERRNDGDNRGERGVLPGDCGYMLHALSMELMHPIEGTPLYLVARPPPSLCVPAELLEC